MGVNTPLASLLPHPFNQQNLNSNGSVQSVLPALLLILATPSLYQEWEGGCRVENYDGSIEYPIDRPSVEKQTR